MQRTHQFGATYKQGFSPDGQGGGAQCGIDPHDEGKLNPEGRALERVT